MENVGPVEIFTEMAARNALPSNWTGDSIQSIYRRWANTIQQDSSKRRKKRHKITKEEEEEEEEEEDRDKKKKSNQIK